MIERDESTHWRRWHSATSIALLVAIGVLVLVFAQTDPERAADRAGWFWLAFAATLIALLMVIGHGALGLWQGALIDEDNRMSLSRMQFLLWSLLVFSSIPVAVTTNLLVDADQPWELRLPTELLIASGISLTVLGTAGIIKADSRTERAKQRVLEANNWQLQSVPATEKLTLRTPVHEIGESDADTVSVYLAGGTAQEERVDRSASTIGEWEYVARGVNAARIDPRESSWKDLLLGTIVAGWARVDLARTQMLVLSVTLIVVYSAQILDALSRVSVDKANSDGPILFTYPGVSTEFVGLLGLASGGYVAGKLIDIRNAKQG